MNESQLAFVKEYKFDNPLIHKIESIIDKVIEIVIIFLFIHLNIVVYTVLILQILEIMK